MDCAVIGALEPYYSARAGQQQDYRAGQGGLSGESFFAGRRIGLRKNRFRPVGQVFRDRWSMHSRPRETEEMADGHYELRHLLSHTAGKCPLYEQVTEFRPEPASGDNIHFAIADK